MWNEMIESVNKTIIKKYRKAQNLKKDIKMQAAQIHHPSLPFMPPSQVLQGLL